MTFVTYYTDLLASGSIGGYIAIGLLALALLIVILQAFLAYGRGTSRSAMRLITVAATAALSFFVTRLIGRAFLENATFADYLPLPTEALRPILDTKVSLVVLPLVFVFVYFLIAPFTILLHKLLCGILGFSYKNNNLCTRIFGAVLGAVQGAVFAVLILLPVFNVCALYGDAVAGGRADASAVGVYENHLEATEKSPFCEYAMKFGGDWLLGEFEAANTDALPKE